MQTATESPEWIVLVLPLPASGREYLLVDALHRLGAHTVERDGDRVVAHVPSREDPATFLVRARGVLHAVDPHVASGMRWRTGSEREALRAWSRDARGRRVGGRIRLVPVGDASRPEILRRARHGPDPPGGSHEVAVLLVPGPAFGTGDHPTTRGCLRLLESVTLEGNRVGDIGAGSGILTVAAVRLGAAFVIAMEADPASCDTLRRTVAVNGISRRTHIVCARVEPAGLGSLGPFDGVMANLGTEMVEALLPGLTGALAAGGWAILSGIPEIERTGILQRARDLGMSLEADDVEAGWWTGRLRSDGPPPLPLPARRRAGPPSALPLPGAPEPE